MRKLLVAALVASSVAGISGVASASILGPKCPDGYVGVVVDEHNVCTNIGQYIKTGG